jgi:hypothetical protein
MQAEQIKMMWDSMQASLINPAIEYIIYAA